MGISRIFLALFDLLPGDDIHEIRHILHQFWLGGGRDDYVRRHFREGQPNVKYVRLAGSKSELLFNACE